MAKITKAQAETKIERYLELQALIKEASKEADALKAELKELANGTEARTYVAGDHSVSITTATRKSVDAKALAVAGGLPKEINTASSDQVAKANTLLADKWSSIAAS